MAYPKTRSGYDRVVALWDDRTHTGHVQYVPAGWDIGPGEVVYAGSAQGPGGPQAGKAGAEAQLCKWRDNKVPCEPIDVPLHVIDAWCANYRVKPAMVVRIPVEDRDVSDS